VNTLYCLENGGANREFHPQGTKFTPGGQIRPWGQSLPLGVKLRMGLRLGLKHVAQTFRE
jgi:hypothetical protein